MLLPAHACVSWFAFLILPRRGPPRPPSAHAGARKGQNRCRPRKIGGESLAMQCSGMRRGPASEPVSERKGSWWWCRSGVTLLLGFRTVDRPRSGVPCDPASEAHPTSTASAPSTASARDIRPGSAPEARSCSSPPTAPAPDIRSGSASGTRSPSTASTLSTASTPTYDRFRFALPSAAPLRTCGLSRPPPGVGIPPPAPPARRGGAQGTGCAPRTGPLARGP
jgi:hypothetical protein